MRPNFFCFFSFVFNLFFSNEYTNFSHLQIQYSLFFCLFTFSLSCKYDAGVARTKFVFCNELLASLPSIVRSIIIQHNDSKQLCLKIRNRGSRWISWFWRLEPLWSPYYTEMKKKEMKKKTKLEKTNGFNICMQNDTEFRIT